jgi:hypothetical protein
MSRNIEFGDINDIRITGDDSTLRKWEALLALLAEKGAIQIVESPSKSYPNRNSILERRYYKIKIVKSIDKNLGSQIILGDS